MRVSILPPTCIWNVRSVMSIRRAPSTASTAAPMSFACSSPAVSIVMSRSVCPPSRATRSTDPMLPPASPMAVATRPSMPGRWSISTRRMIAYWAETAGMAGGSHAGWVVCAAMGLDRALLRLASVVVLGTIMSILDTTIVNVAIETLGRELGASLSAIQWVSTGYLLALATVIPLTGWAMERFGGRNLWMLSVTLFLIGSVLCGLAWSTSSLIAFRVLQGFGGGMIMPVGQAILAQAAGPERMGRIMSVIGVPTLLGPILGPVIGGLIVDNVSWRWIFFVNLPVGAIALALAARVLPRAELSGRRVPLDFVGLLLLSPGLAFLIFGFSEVGMQGTFMDWRVWLGVGVGVVALTAFVWRALKVREGALIDLALFRDRAFAAASGTTFIFGV